MPVLTWAAIMVAGLVPELRLKRALLTLLELEARLTS